MALLCVRNTALKDVRARQAQATWTEDRHDATVADAEGRHIPGPEVSHFDDNPYKCVARQAGRHSPGRSFPFRV